MLSEEIFVTMVVALAISVSNSLPYYNNFKQTDRSPNEADFLRTTKFGNPDSKDTIHYRLILPDQKPTGSLNENKTNQIVVNLGNPTVLTRTDNITKLSTVGNVHLNDHGNPYLSNDYEHRAGKGEIFIHRPSPIIIQRPPTKLLINHPPLVVKPAPVVFHRPPPIVVRPVIVKSKSRKVNVEPVYVNIEAGKTEKHSAEDKENFDKTLYERRFYPARNGIYKKSP